MYKRNVQNLQKKKKKKSIYNKNKPNIYKNTHKFRYSLQYPSIDNPIYDCTKCISNAEC